MDRIYGICSLLCEGKFYLSEDEDKIQFCLPKWGSEPGFLPTEILFYAQTDERTTATPTLDVGFMSRNVWIQWSNVWLCAVMTLGHPHWRCIFLIYGAALCIVLMFISETKPKAFLWDLTDVHKLFTGIQTTVCSFEQPSLDHNENVQFKASDYIQSGRVPLKYT